MDEEKKISRPDPPNLGGLTLEQRVGYLESEMMMMEQEIEKLRKKNKKLKKLINVAHGLAVVPVYPSTYDEANERMKVLIDEIEEYRRNEKEKDNNKNTGNKPDQNESQNTDDKSDNNEPNFSSMTAKEHEQWLHDHLGSLTREQYLQYLDYNGIHIETPEEIMKHRPGHKPVLTIPSPTIRM